MQNFFSFRKTIRLCEISIKKKKLVDLSHFRGISKSKLKIEESKTIAKRRENPNISSHIEFHESRER